MMEMVELVMGSISSWGINLFRGMKKIVKEGEEVD